MAKHRGWTREELMMAMNLYCRLPFGRLHKGTPEIIALAHGIGRTPSSVAMKLGNLASLDPSHQSRGVSGLSKASSLDQEVWNEFHNDWENAANESQLLFDAVVPDDPQPDEESWSASVPKEADVKFQAQKSTDELRMTRVRLGQRFFRRSVLASYNVRCCISGISIRSMLVASHILPWGAFPEHRVNPCNGLCLSALHDVAFDRGLITLDDKLQLVVSRRLKKEFANSTVLAAFGEFEGKSIECPEKFKPNADFLTRHRKEIFVA